MLQLEDDVMDCKILGDFDQMILRRMRLLRRPLSIPELRLLRHCCEVERCREEDGECLMAAATDDLNEAMRRESAEMAETVFRSADGLYRVTVRMPSGKGSRVYLKMTDQAGNPVSGGRIVFPGCGREFALNVHGRISIDPKDYLACLNAALSIQCAANGTETMDLVVEGLG